MILKCGLCGFLFKRADPPEQCPDCGKEYILPATDDEEVEFQKLKSGE